MKLLYTFFMHFVCLVLMCQLMPLSHAANDQKKNDGYSRLKYYQQIDWSQYTLAALKNKLPKKFYGSDVSLLPVQSLYFLPAANLFEMNSVWESSGTHWPQAIVIANGVYNLKQLHRLIANPAILKKIDNKTYISYRPIYVAPTASLVIDTKEFRLSLADGVFIMVNGNIYIIDSLLTSWDETTDHYGFREKIADNKLLFYGEQFPRPYLLGLSGSEIYAGNSIFRGLGYKGGMGAFGVSMNKRLPLKSEKINSGSSLRNKKKPTGWLIGNTFEHNFFGYYNHNAKDVVIAGNIFRDNLIYNIDPHDYSENLLIARNLSYQAKHAHGIIISRGVNNSTIAENIAAKNFSAGIMLDRSSEHNLIYNNLVLENRGEGIAVYESDNNALIKNTISRNQHNGIFVRNSCDISVQSNNLFRNVKSGAEISVVNIDFLETRDFILDAYHKAASAKFITNTFDSNLGVAISSKNKSVVMLKGNVFKNTGSAYFSGDLEPYNRKIISNPDTKEFVLRGNKQCP